MFRFIFNIRDNADYTFRFVWTDINGQPVDLEGSEFLMQGKVTPGAPGDPIFELSSADGEIVVDPDITPTKNQFTITFARGIVPIANGFTQSSYYSDILRKVDDAVTTVGYGVVVCSKGPTQWPPP